jgi:hypothetical protein
MYALATVPPDALGFGFDFLECRVLGQFAPLADFAVDGIECGSGQSSIVGLLP